jgi:hypothetical protein
LAKTTPAPQINLKEPVTGRMEALGKKEICLVLSVDVGHAPVIDQNFDRLAEIWQGDGLRRNVGLLGGAGRDRIHPNSSQKQTYREGERVMDAK